MKSAIILASAGVVLGQAITSDIAAISSAAAQLNSQVSGFSEYAQASAIVDSSQNIVSLINKGAQDATSGGMISTEQVTNLLAPFQSLQAVVAAAIDNLVGRKAVATSLSLGNVVEAQIVSQLSAAEAFASAVEAQLPALFSSIGASLAGAILSDLSSGSSAFSGLSGPSTLGASAPGSASASATSVASSAIASASASVSSSGASASASVSSLISSVASSASTASAASSAPTASSTVTPSSGANKAAAGFFGVAAAAFAGMLAL